MRQQARAASTTPEVEAASSNRPWPCVVLRASKCPVSITSVHATVNGASVSTRWTVVRRGCRRDDDTAAVAPWTATYWVLRDLYHLGLPPDSPVMQETAHLIGTYLGMDVEPVVQRLVADQMPDGGWNCWVQSRPAPSSFASTLDVIDARLSWERHDDPSVRASPRPAPLWG
jgi:hypothetical protein